MPPLAQAALAASIVLSALGAVVICLLTAVYGFTPPSEESPLRTTRRLFLTRVGHAVAASCFAGTAILLAVVLAQSRSTAPPAGDDRVPGLASRMDAHTQRLEGVERRMKDSEQTLERLEMEVSEVTSQRNAAATVTTPTRVPEPAVTRTPAKTPEKPRAAVAPKPAEQPRPTSATVKPAPVAASKTAASTPRPAEIMPAPPVKPAPVAGPKPAVSAAKPAEILPAPPRPAEPTAVAGPSADRSVVEEPAASPAPPPPASPKPRPRNTAPPPPRDFRSKLRQDWQEIRRGWESAGDDFRAAIDRLRNGGN